MDKPNEGHTGFVCGQANFYWSKEASSVRFGAGLGRWRKLVEYYYDINSQEDMENAMKAVRYSRFITNGGISRDWAVDWITEMNDMPPRKQDENRDFCQDCGVGSLPKGIGFASRGTSV